VIKKKIKVLECIRQGQVGGGESHLLSLIEHMDRSCFEPVVLSFTDGPMVDRLKAMGVESHVIYTEKPFDVGKWGRVKKLLKEQRVDLVHAHGTRANSNVLWAARSLKIPVVYTVHGWSFHRDQHPLVRNIRIFGEKYLTSRSDVNVSVSASNKQSGKDHIPNFESIVINNGIDRRKFSPSNTFRNVREELGIPGEALLVLFIARLTVQKQPLTMIRAFQRCLAQQPDLRLLMVGDGDQRQEAVQLAESLGISDRVIFQRFRQDVPDLLAAADIFVLPSLWEGLPIGLLEAMSMGKAVIATNVDGTKEIIRHGENGLLAEPGSIDALSAAILELTGEGTLRKKLQDKALETIQERFNAGHMTRKIENVYKNIVHGI
jgi:glycosyltransferase involved in cell wall biosynthesis